MAPGADLRRHARISRSFSRASLGAALMYSVMVLDRAFLEVTFLFYQVAQRKRRRMATAPAILLGEGIFDFDAEVFLTGIEVFGPDALGAGLLGGGDDHAIVKM